MRAAGWMAAGSLASALTAMAVVGRQSAGDIACGMAAPLAAAGGSWIMAERIWRQAPDRLTAAMLTAFGAKMVFFGAYVTVMLGVVGLHPGPFMASFVAYFIGLYLVEALLLRRLFLRGR